MIFSFGSLRMQPVVAAMTLGAAFASMTPSAGATDADASWTARSTHPDVLMATRFDTAAEVFDDVHPDSRQGQVFWDRNNRASGEGSMRIEIYKTDRSAYGSWRRYLSDDQREFDEGDEFYVQFRQYIPAYMATHKFLNGNGWKQIIISHMSGSNQLNEVVLQNTNHRGMVQGYNRNIGGGYPPWDVSASTACSPTDFRIQNAVDNGPQSIGTACENDRARYGGLFSFYYEQFSGYSPGSPDPLTGGFIYYPDEWLTFLIRVRIGTYGQNDHLVQVWAARDGGNYQMLIDRNNIQLGGGTKLHNTVWLLPFNTNTEADPSREDTYTLYDELIVSTSFIASPAAAVGEGGPQISLQANPLTVNPGDTTQLTWDVVDATTCTASDGWSGSRPLSGNEISPPLSSDTPFTLTCTGPDGTKVRTINVAVVAPDTQPPALASISASGTPPVVRVSFSEPVEAVSATTAGNYQINNGVTVQSVEAGSSDSEVVLTTSAMVDQQSYALTVNNVLDQSVTPNTVAPNSQLSFTYDAGVTITGLDPASYQWGVLDISENVYIDRSFTYSQVPGAYVGLDYLLTANNDKNASGDPFLSFTVDQPVTVFVGYDVRNTTLPTWLAGWDDTEDQWVTSDTTFNVFSRQFAAGSVELGGNEMGNSMYGVAVRREVVGTIDSTPVAVDDTLAVTGTEQGVIIVLQNDLGLVDTPLTLSIVGQPANGSVQAAGLAGFSYTANAGFSGQDQFTYRLTDADGDFDDAVVTVQVSLPDVSDAKPAAIQDSATTAQDVAVTVAVLDNDSELDDTPISLSIETAPVHGTAAVLSNNSVLYTPATGFAGGDAFSYRITDADGDWAQATVTITVTANPGTNSEPLAVEDTVSMQAGTVATIDVLANDGGLLDTPVTVEISANPQNGSASVQGDQTLRYEPQLGFAGTDVLSYLVRDADGDTTEARVVITVTAPPPTAVPLAVSDSAITLKESAVTIDVLANDAGLLDAPLSLTISSQAAFGTATVEADSTITYMPGVDFVGQDTFVYKLADSDGDESAAVVAVTVNDVVSDVVDVVDSPPASSGGGGGGGAAGIWLLFGLWLATLWRRAAMPTWLARAVAIMALGTLGTTAGASELSDVASAMSPGTFAEVSTSGLSSSFMTGGGCSSPITSFSDNAVWDPNSRNFLFIGGPHGCSHSFAAYNEATNSWSNWQPYSSDATHGYDHTTIDVSNRKVWFRKHSAGGFHSFNLDSRTWNVNAIPKPSTSFTQVSGGLEYFPEIGKLVHINYAGGGEVEIFESGSWNEYADVSFGDRAAFIEYNPQHELMLFGGGWIAPQTFSKKIYTLDRNGNVSQKANAPLGLGITKTIVTVDPVSGKYLVFSNGKSFYEYDVTNDSWKQLGVSVPFLQTSYVSDEEVVGTVAAPVSTHGVVMFLQYLGSGAGGSKVWLYKHDESANPVTTTVTLTASPTTVEEGQSTVLTWSSQDAGACVASGAWSGLRAISGTETSNPLDSVSTFSLTCTGPSGSASGSVTVDVTEVDNTPPSIAGVTAVGDAELVRLEFSEPVNAAGASDASNYTIDNGVTVLGATANVDGLTVDLVTTPLVENLEYTLTVNNVYDMAPTPHVIAANSEVSFNFLAGLGQSNTAPASYEWGKLAVDELVYVDRAYTFADVPSAYAGADYLLTANDDKNASGPASVAFDVDNDVTVFVAYDIRNTTLPGWLQSGWTASGDRLVTSDTSFTVFSRDYSAGRVELGGNEMGNSMYSVVLKQQSTPSEPPPEDPPPSDPPPEDPPPSDPPPEDPPPSDPPPEDPPPSDPPPSDPPPSDPPPSDPPPSDPPPSDPAPIDPAPSDPPPSDPPPEDPPASDPAPADPPPASGGGQAPAPQGSNSSSDEGGGGAIGGWPLMGLACYLLFVRRRRLTA